LKNTILSDIVSDIQLCAQLCSLDEHGYICIAFSQKDDVYCVLKTNALLCLFV